MIWIILSFFVKITINTTAFAPNLEGDLYAMFNITTTDQRGNVVNNTILTTEFRVTVSTSILELSIFSCSLWNTEVSIPISHQYWPHVSMRDSPIGANSLKQL